MAFGLATLPPSHLSYPLPPIHPPPSLPPIHPPRSLSPIPLSRSLLQVFASCFLCPLELLKLRVQTDPKFLSLGVRSSLAHIVRAEGVSRHGTGCPLMAKARVVRVESKSHMLSDSSEPFSSQLNQAFNSASS